MGHIRLEGCHDQATVDRIDNKIIAIVEKELGFGTVAWNHLWERQQRQHGEYGAKETHTWMHHSKFKYLG